MVGNSHLDQGFMIYKNVDTVCVDSFRQHLCIPTQRIIDFETWHHIVASYEGASQNVSVYLDGQPLGSVHFDQSLKTDDASQVRLGERYWSGNIDEVAIYNHTLDAAAVARHFNASGNMRPLAPAGMTATATDNAVTVNWTAAAASAPQNQSAVEGYVVSVYQGSTKVQSIATKKDATSATVSGIAAGTYRATVSGLNGFGVGIESTSTDFTVTGKTLTYASSVRADNPLHYFRFEATNGDVGVQHYLSDSVGHVFGDNRYGGSRSGGQLVNEPGNVTFHSPNQESLVPAAVDMPAGNASRSLELWFKPDGPGHSRLVQVGPNETDRAFVLNRINDEICVDSWNQQKCFAASRTIETNKWYHVVGSYESSSQVATVYLDGQWIGSAKMARPLNAPAGSQIRIGGGGYSGEIDEVAVYGYTLTHKQAREHFRAGMGLAPEFKTRSEGAKS